MHGSGNLVRWLLDNHLVDGCAFARMLRLATERLPGGFILRPLTTHQQIGGEMKRWIALASTTLCTLAMVAVGAASASGQVPGGQGLESFGFATCDGLGEVEIFGPPAEPAPTGYLIITAETAQHVVATQFELTFDGEVVFSKSFGNKAGLSTIECTQTFEEPGEGTGVFTLTAAVVPPH